LQSDARLLRPFDLPVLALTSNAKLLTSTSPFLLAKCPSFNTNASNTSPGPILAPFFSPFNINNIFNKC
jgi:hypothetical protein